jgi:hypothetical protein
VLHDDWQFARQLARRYVVDGIGSGTALLPRIMLKSLLGRFLIYLVVIPLALVALVPNSFDTLHLMASGQITLDDVAPWAARWFRKAPAVAPLVDDRFDVAVEDLGDGNYSLAHSEWGGVRSGTQMRWRLNELAARFCADRQATPHVAQSGFFNSKGYNEADLKFRCESGLPANRVLE